MFLGLGFRLTQWFKRTSTPVVPGGKLLIQGGTDGILLQDGTSFLTMQG